jgi:hypothetical protein
MRDDDKENASQRGFAAMPSARRQALARTGWETLKLDARTGALVRPAPSVPAPGAGKGTQSGIPR